LGGPGKEEAEEAPAVEEAADVTSFPSREDEAEAEDSESSAA
jgi:hypothetical protein